MRLTAKYPPFKGRVTVKIIVGKDRSAQIASLNGRSRDTPISDRCLIAGSATALGPDGASRVRRRNRGGRSFRGFKLAEMRVPRSRSNFSTA